jgi:glycerophosphoryl diester phosphodiesterase
VKILGHRGASAHEIENTMAAFRRARADGADGVELDVRRCASGEVVVFHDEDLRRLAGRPERVAALPLAALRAVRLGERGEPIPLLAEVLEELAGLFINVEIKAPRTVPPPGLVAATARVIARHGRPGTILVSSFNPLALLELRARAPRLPVGLLFHAGQSRPLREAWARHALRPRALHPEHVLVDEARAAAWRGEGLEINVWTVDAPEDLRRMRRAGVDAVISNDPGAARRVLMSPAES